MSMNLAKRQIDSFSDWLLRFRNFMLPKLLHGSRHDDQRSIPRFEGHRLSGCVVPNSKLPCRS